MARYIPLLLEIVVAALLLIGLSTQVLLPALQGRKLFPLFRKSERELREQITEIRQAQYEEHLAARAAEANPEKEN